MGRILAIDYGRRRCGVAVTDPLQIIAGGLGTIPTHQLLKWVTAYVQQEQVDVIVIGLPTQLNGQPSESMRYIKPFIGQLRKALPAMPVEMYDERFTSTIAHQAMIAGGMKKSDRQQKGRVDSIAATIILEDYLESRRMQQQ